MRVVAVAGLVHRRRDRVEPGRVEARRETDVAVRERRAERVDGRVQAHRALLESERVEEAVAELALAIGVVREVEEGRVDARRLLHELGQDRPDRSEDLGDLGRLHERLEVVEERRVRRVVPLEALDVAALQLEVPFEHREEAGEVVVRARLDPDLVAESRRTSHLGAKLGRHAALLLPVAARDADQARVVRVVLERLLERPEAFEQTADLVVDELLVRDAAQRRERLGPRRMPAGRHRHLLIPGENEERAREIGDLGQPLTKRAQVPVHRGGLYPRR